MSSDDPKSPETNKLIQRLESYIKSGDITIKASPLQQRHFDVTVHENRIVANPNKYGAATPMARLIITHEVLTTIARNTPNIELEGWNRRTFTISADAEMVDRLGELVQASKANIARAI